ncbi:DUF2188 domain-containing protein [Dokdonella sp.]|uniref:DUF2188 domain-containing protein n=1 Tax=Dokdonella sp. TaxID=2291710 RepID=UPI0037838695
MAHFVMHVVYETLPAAWHIQRDGRSLVAFNTKADAVVAGQLHGRKLASEGGNALLVLHREDGSIETEYRYRCDHRRLALTPRDKSPGAVTVL